MIRHLPHFLFFSLITFSLGADAISCRNLSSAKKQRLTPFVHENKSAVEALGLGYLRNGQDPVVQAWVKDQNKRTQDFLTLDSENRPNALYQAIVERSKDYAPSNPPMPVETRYGSVYGKAGGLVIKDNQGVEKVIVPKLEHGEGRGFSVVTEIKVSADENYIAFSYNKNGLDVNDWMIYDVTAQKIVQGPYAVRLESFSWASNSEGFYYTQWATPEEEARGFFHTQNKFVDIKTGRVTQVFVPPGTPAREFFSIEEMQKDGEKYLIAHRTQGAAEIPQAFYLGSIGKADSGKNEFQVGAYKWKAIRVPQKNVLGKFLAARQGYLYIRTSEAGDNFGILRIDPLTLEKKVIVPAKPHRVLLVAQAFGDKFFLQYLENRKFENEIEVVDLEGRKLKSFKTSDFQLNDIGTLTPFVGSNNSPHLYFAYSDVTTSPVTFKVDSQNLNVEKLASGPSPIDASKITYELKVLKSFDGTKVPLRIFKRKDIAKPKFVYLYYYGYIGMAQQPQWNKKFQSMLDLGGAVAIVSPRGGGEYGAAAQVAAKLNRIPSVLDIVAASIDLKKQGIPKVIDAGRSFGGLQTFNALVHYPQYFDGFISIVPVADVNEFFNRGQFGFFALDDFGVRHDSRGQAIDDDAFRNQISSWSSLQNLKKLENLKPVIIFSGQNDERVGPEQARIMAQALQNQFPHDRNKIHLYEEPMNGHVGRAEFNQEATWVARIVGIKAEDYKPLKRE